MTVSVSPSFSKILSGKEHSDFRAPPYTGPYRKLIPLWPQTWYVVRRSNEVKSGQIVPVRAFKRDWVLMRTSTGKLAMMEGHCTHRGASMGHGGECIDDTLQCPFHGWRYNTEGKCVHIPDVDRIPKAAQLLTLPVVESMGMIFCWYGPEPLFEPPSLKVCGPEDEVGANGKVVSGPIAPAYAFRNVRRCLMRDSICGSLDYQHGNLVHGLRANLQSLEQPKPWELIVTLDVTYKDAGHLGFRKIFGLGDKVTYKGHYWGPAIVYTRFYGRRQMLGHIRMCLPVDENLTQTDMLFIVRPRKLTGRPPFLSTLIRKYFGHLQDDEDAFLDRQIPRAMYIKNFDEGLIAHHRLCLRLGQTQFEGAEPTYDMDESGEVKKVVV